MCVVFVPCTIVMNFVVGENSETIFKGKLEFVVLRYIFSFGVLGIAFYLIAIQSEQKKTRTSARSATQR